MREIFTDKNFITAKLILVAKLLLILALLIFFVPLFVLPFFDHPSADDYICGYNLKNQGFWGYQSFIYDTWGGRFAATFAGAVLAKNNFLYNHYYLHSLLLVLMNIVAVFFLLAVINKHVLKDERLKRNFLFVALLFAALQYCVLVEPSTYIFWFSGAVTYQLPVILLQFQIGLWIIVLHTDKAFIKFISLVLLLLLVFIVNGFNELFIVAQGFILLLLFLSGLYKKLSKFFIALMLIGFITSSLIVVLSPGIHTRTDIIEPKGFLTGAIATGFHVAETLWSICRNPLTWIAFVTIFLYGNSSNERFRGYVFIKTCAKKRWLLPVLTILFAVIAVAIAVFGLKGGIIPDRYVNAIAVITLCFLLLLSFTEGVLANKIFKTYLLQTKLLLLVASIVALLANNYIKDGYKSLISAPVYHAIMNEREAVLKNAAGKHETVVLQTYDTALKEHLENDYSSSSKTLYDLVQQKPSFIFFNDDLATEYSTEILKAFYKVDSITVK